MADAGSKSVHDRWQEAVKIRQEWLGHGLSTQPADFYRFNVYYDPNEVIHQLQAAEPAAE